MKWKFKRDTGVLEIIECQKIPDFSTPEYSIGKVNSPWSTLPIRGIDLQSNVKYIGKKAFSEIHTLEWVSLPQSIVSIGDGAFSGCDMLNEIRLPHGTLLGNFSFKGCLSLENIDLREVGDIGIGAFYGCRSLSFVELFNSSKICDMAFF